MKKIMQTIVNGYEVNFSKECFEQLKPLLLKIDLSILNTVEERFFVLKHGTQREQIIYSLASLFIIYELNFFTLSDVINEYSINPQFLTNMMNAIIDEPSKCFPQSKLGDENLYKQ
jgi:hypothetical protein